MSGFGNIIDRRNKAQALKDQFLNNPGFQLERAQAELDIFKQRQQEYIKLANIDPFSPQLKEMEDDFDLFQNDIESWRKQNKGALGSWHSGGVDKVAPFVAARMKGVMGSSETMHLFVPNSAVYKEPVNLGPSDSTFKSYEGINSSHLDKTFLTGNRIAGIGFSWEPTKKWVKQGVAANFEAVENIYKHKGNVITWDLETLGSDIEGAQRITEFSFSHAVGSFQTGQSDIKKTWGSIIGFTQREYNDAIALINRFDKGEKLSKGEMVTLNRLALAGGKNSIIDWDNAKNGIVRYSTFSEKKDISGIGTAKQMRAGAADLLKVGNYQRENRLANGMLGWEQELVDAVGFIRKNDYTAVGFNTEGFDIRHLDNLLMNSQFGSEAFHKRVSEILDGGHFDINHSFDPLHLEWEIGGDPHEFWTNFYHGDEQKTQQLMSWIEQNGEGPRTQQTHIAARAIMQGISPEALHSGQAHAAEYDSKDVLDIVFATDLYDTRGADSMFKGKVRQAVKYKADGTQLFHALSASFTPGQYGLVSFTKNTRTGEWGGSDAVLIGKGKNQGLYQVPGIRRRGAYSLQGMGKLSKSDPLYTPVSQHKGLGGGDLFYIRLQAESAGKSSMAANQEVVLTGTKRDIMAFMNSNMLYAGEKGANGKWSMASVPEEVRERLRFATVKDGKMVTEEATINGLLQMSDFAFANDATAREARKKDLRREYGLVNYIQDMDRFVKKEYSGNDEFTINNLRRKYRDNIISKTRDVIARQRNGEKVVDFSGTLYKYFGWKDKETHTPTLYETVLDKWTTLEDYGRKNFDVLNASINAAVNEFGTFNDKGEFEETKFLNNKEAAYFYKHVRTEVENAAISKIGRAGAGFQAHPMTMAELQEHFQVNLEGFWGIHGADGTKIESFSTSAGQGLANSILRKLEYPKERIESGKIKDEEKLALLTKFQQHIIRTGAVNIEDGAMINPATDSIAIAGGKITNMFRKARERNPMAGILRPTEMHDVINNLENGGLTKEEANAAAESASKIKLTYLGRNKDEIAAQVKSAAADITRNIVFDNNFAVWEGTDEEKEAFIKKMQELGGYTERDSAKIYAMQRVRYQSSLDLMNKTLNGIVNNGGAFGYDVTNGQFIVYNSTSALGSQKGQVVKLSHNVFANGSFKRQMANGQQFDDLVGLYHSHADNGLRLTTVEGRFAHDSGALVNNILNKGAEENDLANQVQRIFGIVDQQYRNFSVDAHGDWTDRNNSNLFYVGDVPQDLGQRERGKLLAELKRTKGQAAEVMAKYLDNLEDHPLGNPLRWDDVKTFKTLDAPLSTAMNQTAHIWQPFIMGQVNGDVQLMHDILGDSTTNFMRMESHAGDTRGYVHALEDTYGAIAEMSPGTNHAEEKYGRAIAFNADHALKVMDGRGARVGKAINTATGLEQAAVVSRGLGYNAGTSLVVNKLVANSHDMRAIMRDAAEKYGLSKDDIAYKQAMSIYTEEGAAAISAYLADAGLENDNYEQRIHFGKVADSSIEESKNFRKLVEANPTITFDENGKAHFHSGSGIYVEKGEKLFTKAANSTLYNDQIVSAKDEGLLKAGVFKNGMQLSDEAVSDFINKNIVLNSAMTDEERQQAAWKLFEEQNKHGLTFDYYVRSKNIAGNVKGMNYLEKEVSHVLMAGVGDQNKEIAATVKELGAGKLLGSKLHLEVIEEMAKSNTTKGTDFYAYVLGMGDAEMAKAVTEKGVEQRKVKQRIAAETADAIITKHFGSVQNFAEAMLRERYYVSDTMDAMLDKAGYSQGKRIDSFGNTQKALEKHRQATVFENVVNELRDTKNMTPAQIKAELEKHGAISGGLSIAKDHLGNEQLVFDPSKGEFSVDGLDKVIEKHFAGEDGWHSVTHFAETKNGKVHYEVSRSQMVALPNFNRGQASNNGIHEFVIDGRGVDSLRSYRYTQKFLDKASSEDSIINEVFGKYSAFTHRLQKIYDSKADGDVINSEFMKEILEKSYAHEGDPNYVAGSQVLYKDGELRKSKRGYEWLAEQGINKETAEKYIAGMAESGAPEITANKVAEYVQATTAAIAHNFNKDGSYTLEGMQGAGFKLHNIDTMSVSARWQRDEEQFVNSLYGQAGVLDLHSDRITDADGQIYTSGRDRFISWGFDPKQAKDETGAVRKSAVQQKVYKFANAYHEYAEEYEANKTNGVNAKRKASLLKMVEDIQQEVTTGLTNKTGTIHSTGVAHFTEGVTYGTAQGYEFMGKGLDGSYEHLQFLDSGVTFSSVADIMHKEIAERGKEKARKFELGYVFANNYARDAIYTDDTFKKMAGGNKDLAQKLKDKTFRILEKEGTVGVEGRSPFQSLDSLQASNIHFVSGLGKDEFVVNAHTFRQQNGDFDSDKFSSLIQKSRARVTYDDGSTAIMKLDYASYRAISTTRGMNVELLDKKFDESIAAMVHNASEITPYAKMQDSSWGTEKGAKDDSLGTKALKDKGTYDGTHTPNYAREYTNAERLQHENSLYELEAAYNKVHGDGAAAGLKDDYAKTMGEFIGSYKGDEYEKYHEALHYKKWEAGWAERTTEASSKKAAGIMNKGLYELSRIVHDKAQLTGEQFNLFQIGRMALEEGGLSGKNLRGEQDIERANELRDAFNEVIWAMGSDDRSKRETAADRIKTLVTDVFNSREDKEFSGRLDTKIYGDSKDQISKTADLFADIVKNTKISQREQQRLRLAVSKSGLRADETLSMSAEDAARDSISQSGKTMNNIVRHLGVNKDVVTDISNEDPVGSALEETGREKRKRIAEEYASKQMENRNQRYRHVAAEEAVDAASGLMPKIRQIASMFEGGNKVAAAAVGVAAGLMTAGYAAGPSTKGDVPTPSQSQAMYMSNDQGDQMAMQPTPSLADSNLNVMRGGPQSGYVINISAKTDHGQQAAVDAISNAASGMTPQNGSVNVNVNTSLGNSLSQLQVNRMVAHAIGVA